MANSSKLEELNVPESNLSRSQDGNNSALIEPFLRSGFLPQDRNSEVFERGPFANCLAQLSDVSQDIGNLERSYNEANPNAEAQSAFKNRLDNLARTESGRELIEKLAEASTERPEVAGEKIAFALADSFKQRFPQGRPDFSQTIDEFGVVASMVRVVGGNDNEPGGSKERMVESFNNAIAKKFTAGDSAVVGIASDDQGKQFEASPMMVLYDEPGRPPAMVPLANGRIVNPLKYTDD